MLFLDIQPETDILEFELFSVSGGSRPSRNSRQLFVRRGIQIKFFGNAANNVELFMSLSAFQLYLNPKN